MKNCLIVLGMHRSGTSAFTGILDLLGVNLGTKMLEAQSDNPKGFFENKYVVLANDCILESFNSSWDDTLPLPPNWPDRFEDSQLIEDARSFLRTDIAEDQLSGLKDPRLCRLLPFWLPLLAAENISPHFALIIRSPLEIADSLHRRNGFSIEKSLVLWMQYMLEAERSTRDLPRGFVKFESILSEPRGSIENVFKSAGLEQPNFSDVNSEELDQFLDHNMRHHDVSDDNLDARCHKIIADYYRLLCKIAEGEPRAADIEALDELGDRFQTNQRLFYNDDVALTLERAKEEDTPAWYQAKLNRIKAQFDADKIFREYRYIANTEHLYQDRISQQRKYLDIQNETSALQDEISGLQHEMGAQTNTISALRKEIATQVDEITILQSAISSRINEISTRQKEISAQRQARQALHNIISAQKIVMSAQKTENLSRQQEILDLQSEIERRENKIANQQKIISGVNEDLSRQQEIQQLLHAKNDELENLIMRTHSSRVWQSYRKYQLAVDKMFPQGTLLRRMLRRGKWLVTGKGVDAESAPTPGQLDQDNTGHILAHDAETASPQALQEEITQPDVATSTPEHAPVPVTAQTPEEEAASLEDSTTAELPASSDPQPVQEQALEIAELAELDAALNLIAQHAQKATDGLYNVAVAEAAAPPPPEQQGQAAGLDTANPQSLVAAAETASRALTAAQESDGASPDMAATEESADPIAVDSPQDTNESETEPTQEHFTFPVSETPNISIIIPVFNNWSFTHKCLQSLYLHNRGSYEIIVVDNNSTDETPQRLAAMEGIHVITNETNEVFVNACNQAAGIARGNYLLFLNNDTEVSEGWLEAMLAPFSDSSTGIVGAKLVYPDGSLQEAGGIIWSDGNGCNYGHGDNPDLPQYSYRKAVDYCSGACLMISRNLWQEIGGFDQRFAPAYYEDTDLCFTVRSLNYKVIYQPAARVVHYGGASAGKETSSGYKRFQDINRVKFIEKWQAVLDSDHVPSSAGLFRARERTGDKHILIIDHQVPTYDRDSGSLRMLNLLQILQGMDYKVSFWPDELTYDPRYTRKLQNLGIETYYGDLNFEDFIRVHGDELDAVLMSRPATTKKYLQLVKKYSKARTIFDTVDLHYVREQRRRDLEVQRWKNLEFFLAEEADTTLVVSPTEKKMLAEEKFAHKIAVVSNIHSLEPCLKGFEEREGLMFIGSFAHPPNEEGIIWFIEYILPLIKKKIPDIHLTIVGTDPTERLIAMSSESITVTGYVEDVSGYFHNNKVFVSPLLHGAGVKGKIGQSFSYGLPVVTTSIGAEGMQLTDGLNVLVSDSETEFANNVVALYREKFLWQKLSTNCREVIREQFSADTIRTALKQILATDLPKRVIKPASPRTVIVHCHLFKNAGTTLDWSLQREFGSKFVDHRDDDNMRRGASYLKPYLETHRHLSAISSHHVRFPLPVSENLNLLPLISLRHPIDRARSVYDFERRQDAQTPGAIQAKKLSFADYVRWRMQPDVAPTIRNFHCSFCTSNFDSPIGEQDYLDSVTMLFRTPLLVIVERYDESMILLENRLEKFFPGIDLSYIRQNETFGREINLVQRIQGVFDELGPELTVEFREKNHWDMKLYENALAILGERQGSLGNVEKLLNDLQSRCRLLSVATLPSNAQEIPESRVEPAPAHVIAAPQL